MNMKKEANMLNLVCFLICLNTVIITFWWVLGDHPHKAWAYTLCLTAIFVSGFFVLRNRVTELSIKGIGTIKAAVDQASADASTISDLKARVEAQSSTIDAVADYAKKALAQTKELEKITSEAQSKTNELKEASSFLNTLIAAQADDRHAFNFLSAWADEQSSPYQVLAANTISKVRISFAGPIEPGFMNMPLPGGFDPNTFILQILAHDQKDTVTIYRPHLVHLVWRSKIISIREKMEFLVGVLQDDTSLTATFYAGKFFLEGAKDPELKWSPFNVNPLINWWQEHKDQFQ